MTKQNKTLSDKIFGKGKWLWTRDVQQFIKRRDDLDEDLFMLIIGRLMSGVKDISLITKLVREDYEEHIKKRNKLAGKELI